MHFIFAPRTRDLLGGALLAASLLPATHSHAQVSWTGDIDPSDPTTWTTSTDGDVGNTGIGTLDILAGGTVDTRTAFLGHESGSDGTVTVSDAGSLWTIDSTLYVGYRGSGLLNIASGGVVDVAQSTFLARLDGSSGVINFNNGTLSTRNLFASPNELTGTGTINTNGVISDIDFVFDATNGFQQTKTLNTLPGQNITLNVDANGPTTGTWGVGYRGSASLTIADGQVLSSISSYLGYQAGSSGAATVTGAGSAWNVSGTLFVGSAGTGTLNIESGALVTVSGDTWVGQQPAASGAINLNNATFQTNTLFGAVADLMGTGTVNANGLITDIDLVFDASNGLVQTKTLNSLPGQNITLNLDMDETYGKLGAGYRGTGSLTVADGIAVRSRNIDLGFHAGSSGTAIVTGEGSSITRNFWVTVGRSGDGSLTIADGGFVSGRISYLGQIAGATGELNVTGAGSRFEVPSFHIGLSGTGILTIEDGGEAASGSGLIGSRVGSSGTATVTGVGSTWNVSFVRVGNDGQGILTVTNNGTLATSDLTVGYAAAGSLTVANRGHIQVNDDLVFEANGGTAELNFTLASTADPLIDVTDAASLAGTIHADLAVGTALSHGDTFMLIDIGRIQTGTFSNVAQNGSLGHFGNLALLLDYAGGDGNDIVAHAAFLGDANLDGEVSLLDLDILGQHYNEPGAWAQGDFNGDGEVSLIDLDILGQYYGGGTAPLSRSAMLAYIGQPVPEPSSLTLLGLVGLLIARRRRG